ncbi:MAG: hypothetical protein QM478_03290 [Flavobacteriaceae bacterium]
MTIITFDHLIKEELFNNVKREFLEDDEKYELLRLKGTSYDVDLGAVTITAFKEKKVSIKKVKHESIDPNTGELIVIEDEIYDTEVEKVTVDFFSDYLIPKIAEFETVYMQGFVRDIERRNIFSDSAIQNFSQLHMNKLNSMMDDVRKVTHLSSSVKDTLIRSIESVYASVSNGYYQKYFETPTKIPLFLNKNQIITLFRLLRKNEYIPGVKPSRLSEFIERSFTYFEVSSNSQKDITRARDLELQLFGKNSTKSPTITLNELESIFNEKDFFSE